MLALCVFVVSVVYKTKMRKWRQSSVPGYLQKFALHVTNIAVIFAILSILFLLTLGAEKQYVGHGVEASSLLAGGCILLILVCLLLVLLQSKVKLNKVPHSLAFIFIMFGMLMTSFFSWNGAVGSLVYGIALVSWIFLYLAKGGAPKHSKEAATGQHPLPVKLTSFSSSSELISTLIKIPISWKQSIFQHSPYAAVAIANILAFSIKWAEYEKQSHSLALARACAATIYVNVALLPLPTLHRVWSFTYQCLPEGWRPVYNKSISMHRALAQLIVIAGFFHIQGHNAHLTVNHGQIYLVSAWITGVFLAGAMVFVFLWSYVKPPRKRFEQVHIIGGFMCTVLLLAHGSQAFIWCLPGCCLTIVERLLAARPTSKRMRISRWSRHGAGIMYIQLNGNIELTGGEYIYVQVPSISKTEWRPFTVSPEVDGNGVSLFIRIRQDNHSWTSRLAKSLSNDPERNSYQLALIDGPHLSPTCHHVRYSRFILAATGVGCTPILSVLRSMRKINRDPRRDVRQITIAWVLLKREIEDFNWMLEEVVQACEWSSTEDPLVSIRFHIYVTGCIPEALSGHAIDDGQLLVSPIWHSVDTLKYALTNPKAPAVLQSASSKPRPGMLVEVWQGRPLFPSLLLAQGTEAQNDGFNGKIGVFCCGPPLFVRDMRSAVKLVNRTIQSTNVKQPESIVEHDPAVGPNNNNDSIMFELHREVF